MHARVKSVLSTHTFRQSIITVVSTFGAAGLGAIFYLLLARSIGTHEFGLFSVSVSILTLAVSFAEMGMGQGLVKFVAENNQGDKYQPFVKIALVTKTIIGLVVCIGLWIFARPIAINFLHQPELIKLLPAAGLGIFSTLMFSLSIYVFQGLQKFTLWGGLQVSANFFRLIFFALILWLFKINAFWGLILFASAPLFGFVLSWLWLPVRIIYAKFTSLQMRSFWHFNKWTASFTIAASLASRLDTLLTARFLSLSQTGVYALATTMVAFLPQLSSAIGAVTAPKFASFSDHDRSKKYLSKASLLSTGVSISVALAMIPTALLVVRFTGRGFSASFLPFLILLLALTIFTSLNPIRDSLLYYYHRPQFFLWASLVQTAILLISGLLLIPKFGTVGTALSVLLGHIYLGVHCFWYNHTLTKKS